jgi:hypothetical protein
MHTITVTFQVAREVELDHLYVLEMVDVPRVDDFVRFDGTDYKVVEVLWQIDTQGPIPQEVIIILVVVV